MTRTSRSIREKVIVVILATTFVALLVAALALVIYETRTYRESALSDLTTQADLLALTSAPAQRNGGRSKRRKPMFSATDIVPTQALRSGSSGRQRTISVRISARVAR